MSHTPLLAWHGNPDLKAQAVQRMRAHREVDTLIQGSYFESDLTAPRKYLGCFHGCLTAEAIAAERGVDLADVRRSNRALRMVGWHIEAQRLFGIPRELGAVLDNVFEFQVDHTAAGTFAVAALEVMQVGADLSGVVDRFNDFLGQDNRPDSPQEVAVALVALIAAAPIHTTEGASQ